jgi:serine/threonine protein kinase
MGSLEYMAPEVIEYNIRLADDSTAWSFPADVYAYAIMFWEIVTGGRWRCETLRKPEYRFSAEVIKQDKPLRPPVDKLARQAHKGLLVQMWDWNPQKRPTFQQIIELLEQEEYWLPGTDKAIFLEAVNSLKREESRIVLESATECQRFLRQVQFADTLADFLADVDYDNDFDTLTNKLIHSLGYVCGSGQNRNTEVMEAVQVSLKEKQWLDPMVVNRLASEPVNPVAVARSAR